MSSADPFTLKRLCKFIEDHRAQKALMPTLSDLDQNGFSKEVVQAAVKKGLIKELYSDMTTGAVVKVYKVNRD
jgi:hypothetical protein